MISQSRARWAGEEKKSSGRWIWSATAWLFCPLHPPTTSSIAQARSNASMSDLRYTAASQLEHLHSRYTGSINADTEK